MATPIYHSNISEYKEYTTKAGIRTAVKRYTEAHPDAVNILDILAKDEKQMARYLRWNPWVDSRRADYDGDIILVRPYKDGYMTARHFALKPQYDF